MPHVLLVDRVQRGLLQREGTFDKARPIYRQGGLTHDAYLIHRNEEREMGMMRGSGIRTSSSMVTRMPKGAL